MRTQERLQFVWLASHLRGEWPRGGAVIGLAVFSTCASLCVPLIVKEVADSILVLAPRRLAFTLGGAGLVVCLLAILELARQLLFVRLQHRVLVSLQSELLEHVLRLPREYYDANRPGYILARVTSDVSELQGLVAANSVAVVTQSIQFICALTIAVWLNPTLATIALLVVPGFALMARVWGPSLRRRSRAALEASARVSRDIAESLTAATVVKICNAEAREAARLSNSVATALRANFARGLYSGAYELSLGVIAATGMCVVVWFGVGQVQAGTATVGGMIAFVGYVGLVLGPARYLASVSGAYQQAVAAAERIGETRSLRAEDVGRAIEPTNVQGPVRIAHSVTFDCVSFAYPGSGAGVREISFSASASRLTAILGPSGAGKSTVANLLLGLYRPTSGEIYVDGCPLTGLPLRDVRRRIGYVAQESVLFDDSIERNIGFGDPTAGLDQIVAAAKEAHVHDFITSLPAGYLTEVGDRGCRLSMGQRQRVAIARALVARPDIVILDEPTSALDHETALAIELMIRELAKTRIVIVITHQLATTDSADWVVIMKDGRCVRSGPGSESQCDGASVGGKVGDAGFSDRGCGVLEEEVSNESYRSVGTRA